MERGRAGSGNGEALGDVARDVMDHATAIARDQVNLGKLAARRYAERVRREMAPRAAFVAAAGVVGGLAGVFGLLALFLGIAQAISSVPWTFAIYSAVFAVVAVVLVSLSARTPRRDEGEEIARRFPAARMKETRPEHLIVVQRSAPEAHAEAVSEARREAGA